jgi:hypothetical protein
MEEKYVTLTIVPSSSLLANARSRELEKLGVKNYVICDRKGRGLAIRVLKKDFSKARSLI